MAGPTRRCVSPSRGTFEMKAVPSIFCIGSSSLSSPRFSSTTARVSRHSASAASTSAHERSSPAWLATVLLNTRPEGEPGQARDQDRRDDVDDLAVSEPAKRTVDRRIKLLLVDRDD